MKYIIVDLFCGAGGTTTGFASARINGQPIAAVAACVNHDHMAIKSHWENHPDVEHFTEDITQLYGHVKNGILFHTKHMMKLIRIVDIYRACYPEAKVILWASLECTNFSKAKGGQARDADSRTLAHHLDRYVAAIDPDYVQIENVVEFMAWGPMKNGKPVSTKNGLDWLRWKEHLCTFNNYRDDWRVLNSADFGAYTARKRLFGVFAKPDMPIVWPQPTHTKEPSKGGLFGSMKKWKPVKDVLNLANEGQSIFTRKKPLVDPSLERIYAGLIKFVAGGKDAFILKYNSMSSTGIHVPPSIDEPAPTVACQNRLGIVQTVSYMTKYYSGHPSSKNKSIEEPTGTITTIDHHYIVNAAPWVMNTNFQNVGTSIEDPAPTLVSSRRHPYLAHAVPFISASNGGIPSAKVSSVELPGRVITASDNKALVTAQPFITQRNGGDPEGRLVDVAGPARTLTSTAGNQELVSPVYLIKYYSTGPNLNSADEPAGTLGTKDTLAKIQTEWLERQFGSSQVASVDTPAGVIMPNDKHRLIQCDPIIMNPSHGGHSTSGNAPCPVIVARQDKAPLYLIQYVCDENAGVAVYETDSEVMVRIKIFMAMYGISDIKMRMLMVDELLLIQGFPKDYVLKGTQADQKKFIGNSVVPHVVKSWIEAMGGYNDENYIMAA